MLIKENISMGLAYRFRGFVQFHKDGNCGVLKSDMVLKNEPRDLHLDQQVGGRETNTGSGLSI